MMLNTSTGIRCLIFSKWSEIQYTHGMHIFLELYVMWLHNNIL